MTLGVALLLDHLAVLKKVVSGHAGAAPDLSALRNLIAPAGPVVAHTPA